MLFFYIYKSLTVCSWVNRTRFTVSLVYPSCRAERKRSINSNISCFFLIYQPTNIMTAFKTT